MELQGVTVLYENSYRIRNVKSLKIFTDGRGSKVENTRYSIVYREKMVHGGK